jgi:hypothetical protein
VLFDRGMGDVIVERVDRVSDAAGVAAQTALVINHRREQPDEREAHVARQEIDLLVGPERGFERPNASHQATPSLSAGAVTTTPRDRR